MATPANPLAGRCLPPPRGFDGAWPELFEDFAVKLKSYLGLQESDFSEVIDMTSKDPQPIADNRLVTRGAGGQQILGNSRISMPRHLKHTLVLLCSGAPLTVIRVANAKNGIGCCRLLLQS